MSCDLWEQHIINIYLSNLIVRVIRVVWVPLVVTQNYPKCFRVLTFAAWNVFQEFGFWDFQVQFQFSQVQFLRPVQSVMNLNIHVICNTNIRCKKILQLDRWLIYFCYVQHDEATSGNLDLHMLTWYCSFFPIFFI
jgi:hypothetical protein